MTIEQKLIKQEDPDLVDFREYNSLIRRAQFFAECRAQVGETSSAEDIGTTASEAETECAKYTAEIAKLMKEAEKHLAGAKRWAYSCRVQLAGMLK